MKVSSSRHDRRFDAIAQLFGDGNLSDTMRHAGARSSGGFGRADSVQAFAARTRSVNPDGRISCF